MEPCAGEQEGAEMEAPAEAAPGEQRPELEPETEMGRWESSA